MAIGGLTEPSHRTGDSSWGGLTFVRISDLQGKVASYLAVSMLGATPLEVVTSFPAPRIGVEEKSKGSLPNVASLDSISSQTSQSSRPQRERKPHVTYEPEILHSVFPTSSGGFAKGSRIYILGTGQVMQRSPHYVGRVGTVKEVPGK